MSIGFTHAEEKESDSTAQRADNERGHSMAGRIGTQSSKLSAVFAGVDANVPASAGGLDIRQVTCDSRKVQPRALFFALHGAKADGNAFIRDAVKRGAVAIASEDAAFVALQTEFPKILQSNDAREFQKALREGRQPAFHGN